jgi:hypothetical protein
MFSTPILFNIKGKESFSTRKGGVLTLIFIVCSLLMFLAILYQMIYSKTGMILSYSETMAKIDSEITYGKDFFIALGIYGNNQFLPFNPDFLNITLKNSNFSLNNQGNNLDVNITQSCPLRKIDKNELPLYFDDETLKDDKKLSIITNFFYTFDAVNKSFFFGGNIAQQNSFSRLELSFPIFINTNLSANLIKDQIDYLFSIQEIHIIISYGIPQILNFTNPYKRISKYLQISNSTSNTFYMKKVNFESYESLFPFSEPISDKYYSFSRTVEKTVNFGINIVLDIEDDSYYVYRRYDTFDSYLARFTSLNSTLLMIISLLAKFISRYDFKVYIFNKFYKIPNKENVPQKDEIELKSSNEIKSKISFNLINRKGNLMSENNFFDRMNVKVNLNEINLNDNNVNFPEFIMQSPDNKLAKSNENFPHIFYELELVNQNNSEFNLEKYLNDLEHYFMDKPKKKFRSPIFKFNEREEFIFNHFSKNFDLLFSVENVLKSQIELNRLKEILFDENQKNVFSCYYVNPNETLSKRNFKKKDIFNLMKPCTNIFKMTMNQNLMNVLTKEFSNN